LLLEVTVQSLGLDRTTNMPVVILQETEGERVLPIWIGPGEASAIAMHLADMDFSRPLTHDLLCSVLRGLECSLDKVVISHVEESTYFAELRVQRNGDLISLDARPSDSIAIALRMRARIFVSDDLLETATIEIAEDEVAPSEIAKEPELPDAIPSGDPELMGPDELKEHLKKLNPEDFGRFKP